MNELYGISKSLEVTCVDVTDIIMDVPNILRLIEDDNNNNKKEGKHSDNDVMTAYEIITPTVIQVIRNHFDCQILSGARLWHFDRSRSCFGSYWNERFFFGKDWTPSDSSSDKADVDDDDDWITLFALTLAVLEDSSWYKDTADVPNYSQGFFCSSSSSSISATNNNNDDDIDNLNYDNNVDGKLSTCDYTSPCRNLLRSNKKTYYQSLA